MEVKKKMLTLDLEPTFQRRLKVVARPQGSGPCAITAIQP